MWFTDELPQFVALKVRCGVVQWTCNCSAVFCVSLTNSLGSCAFSSVVKRSGCQYECSWFSGNTHLWSDLLWDVKFVVFIKQKCRECPSIVGYLLRIFAPSGQQQQWANPLFRNCCNSKLGCHIADNACRIGSSHRTYCTGINSLHTYTIRCQLKCSTWSCSVFMRSALIMSLSWLRWRGCYYHYCYSSKWLSWYIIELLRQALLSLSVDKWCEY